MELSESLLHYVWKYQLLHITTFNTISGKKLIVKKAGIQNTNAGPDFFNARILVDDIELVGNIEIHINNSDFLKHNHQNDIAYQSLILHVVYNYDKSILPNMPNVEVFELKNYIQDSLLPKYNWLMQQKNLMCKNSIAKLDVNYLNLTWESLYFERIEGKVNKIQQQLTEVAGNWDWVFIKNIFMFLCGPVNKPVAELFLQKLDYQLLLKYQSQALQLEALLFGQAGFLSDEENSSDEYFWELKKEYLYLKKLHKLNDDYFAWNFLRLRPANFPTVRLAQLAGLLQNGSLFSKLMQQPSVKIIYLILNTTPSKYWLKHYHFAKQSIERPKAIGKKTIDLISINVIVPMLMTYSDYTTNEQLKAQVLHLIQEVSAEQNTIVKQFENASIKPQNALQSQAMIELYTNYCSRKKCLQCSIGYKILGNYNINFNT